MKVWEVPSKGNSHLNWQASDNEGNVWFNAEINTEIMHASVSSNNDVANTLIQLLSIVKKFNPGLFEHKTLRIETETEFALNSGLGTSSTLVCLLADWSGIDPFMLQKEVFQGSGYDVAVCRTGKPIVYWLENSKPCWSPFHLDDSLTKNWVLIFTGKKMNSREAVSATAGRISSAVNNPLFRWQLDQIVKGLKNPGNKIMLEAGIEMWQGMLSTLLGLKRTYDDLGLIPVPGGMCKYLGAWGGDVILTNDVFLAVNQARFEGMEQTRWSDIVIQ